MDKKEVRDSAFESVDAEDYGAEDGNEADTSLDMLQQQQAKEQARLLQRFLQMKQWQSQQQEQLMMQQQLQLEMLKKEQLHVQSVLVSQRGSQWGDGRVSRPEVGHKSPPLITPPRRSGLGRELAKSVMAAAAMPHMASTDSGLVASMGDTLEPPKGSAAPVPAMMQTSPAMEEDKYTNPELFSNPGSLGDDLQAVDDCVQFNDMGSDVGSDNFYLPPLPPDPKESQANLMASLNSLQALMGGKAPAVLQQMLGQLPQQQRLLLLEQRQAAVQESASPTFSHVQSHTLPHRSVPSASSAAPVPAVSASLPGYASSEAMFVPRTFTDSLEQTGFGVQPQLQQLHPTHTQRPQAGFQGPAQVQAQIQRPQAQRPQAQFQGPSQAQLHRQQVQFPGPYQAQQQRSQTHFSGPSQAQGFAQDFLAQTSFSSSQNQRQVPPFLSSSTHFLMPSDSHQLPFSEQQLQHRQQQQQLQHRQQQQQLQHRQQQQQPTSYSQQYSAHKHSQQAELSKHMPLEPQVKVRASWEEEEEEGRSGVTEEADTEEDQEEEEDSEELETTVKAAVRNPEDEPIRTGLQGRKTFEQLLEEQLADEQAHRIEEQKKVEQQKTGPVKRPFLRKGQGIARFSQPIKRPPAKKPSSQKAENSRGTGGSSGHRCEPVPRIVATARGPGGDWERSSLQGKGSGPARRVADRKRISGGKRKEEDEDRPQPEKLTLIKRRSETGRKTQQQQETSRVLNKEQQKLASQRRDSEDLDEKDSIADDASFVAGLKEREKKAPLEEAELDEFEALEDIADNMSLVSNSSVVQRLVTPNKQRQKTAVSDLKSVLEQKKTAPPSPFERNAAMRSLLSITAPCPAAGQPQGPAQQRRRGGGGSCEENDDTLTEEDEEDCASDADTDTERVVTARRRRNTMHPDPSDMEGTDGDHTREVAGGAHLFSQGQPVKGVDSSRQFSLFSQQTEAGDGCASSPQKSVTRKVAPFHGRAGSAGQGGDTAVMLQKLSAHAGFLSSGFSHPQQEHGRLKTSHVEEEDSVTDSSLLSSSVSRPQPVVIGGKKGDPFQHTLTSADNNKVDTDSDEDDSDDTVEDDDDDKVCADEAFRNQGALQQEPLLPGMGEEVSDRNSNNANNNNNNNSEDPSEDWEDEEEWASSAPHIVETQMPAQSGSGVAGETTPPTSKLMSRLFPKLKPQPSAIQQQHQQKMEAASSASVGQGLQSTLLREKLAELEAEIENFRTENAALERQRREREEGLRKLKDEIARFDQEKTDELRRLEEFKSQEMKKLKHERKLFETYQKQVRSMPDKKEREEIETLKRQLSDLQDELKRKETRWTSSMTRLKTRITELEGENSEMREEMKMLERKRLEWMQTRPANKPSVSQPPGAVKSTPRSSTPTSDSGATSNGFVDTPALATPATTTLTSGALTLTRQLNAAGAAGKSGSGVGGHNSSGGESMPRGEPATPSMIEGVSPAMLGHSVGSSGHVGGEADGSLWAPQPAPPACRAVDRPSIDRGNGQFEEMQYADGKVERVYSNGSRTVLFANGTRKEISTDGQYFIVSFFNGDIKQVFPDQKVVYYYAESQTTHTTYPDKLEVLQFPNNQTEKHYPDGTHEITFPNQTVKYLFPNGTEESIFPDGTVLRINKSGEKVMEFPNGQREIHTLQHKRREYPDGTVKTLHNDGRQETRYATGRIRLKDKDGNVVMDKMC